MTALQLNFDQTQGMEEPIADSDQSVVEERKVKKTRNG